jgi:hypothetical protein
MLSILFGIVLAVVIMMAMMTHAVMGIEPRKWDTTPKGADQQKLVVQDKWITMDEYMDIKQKPLETELKEINGKNCILENGVTKWCG